MIRTTRMWLGFGCGAFLALAATVVGCVSQQSPTDLVGDAAAGQTLFNDSCARCHSATSLARSADRITNNLGDLGYSMRNITLTDQQVIELQAYLATR